MKISVKKYPLTKVTKSELWNANKSDFEGKHRETSVVEFLEDGEEDNILMCEFDSLSIKDKMLIAIVCGSPSLSFEEEPDMIRRQRFLFLARFTKNVAQELTTLFQQKAFGRVEEQALPLQFLDDILSMTPLGLQLAPFSQSTYFETLKEFLKRFVMAHKNENQAQECIDMLERFDDFDRYNRGLKTSLKASCMLMHTGWSRYESKIVAERMKQLGKL